MQLTSSIQTSHHSCWTKGPLMVLVTTALSALKLPITMYFSVPLATKVPVTGTQFSVSEITLPEGFEICGTRYVRGLLHLVIVSKVESAKYAAKQSMPRGEVLAMFT